MKNGADELMGFVVFTPGVIKNDKVQLKFSKTYARLSEMALSILGKPEAVLVFFDWKQNRLMLQPSTADTVNAVKLSSTDGTNGRSRRRCCILCANFRKTVNHLIGKDVFRKGVTLPGHKADVETPTLIFSLDDVEE